MDTRRPDALKGDQQGPALVTYLESLGYLVQERQFHWFECLISGHGEAWFGFGPTRGEAFAKALEGAFPSHGARVALERAIAHEAPTSQAPRSEAATPEAPPSEAAQPAQATATSQSGDGSPRFGEPSAVPELPVSDTFAADASLPDAPALLSAAQPPEPSVAAPSRPDVDEPPTLPANLTAQGMVVAAEFMESSGEGFLPSKPAGTAPASPSLASPIDEAPTMLSPGPDEGAALEELEDLLAEIEARKEDLAGSAPNRQRLVLLGWLSRARALQDEQPRSITLSAEVGRLVKVLRGMSESWWPGMISAFQLRARPMESYRDIRPHVDVVPMSWSEVADGAAIAVRFIEAQDEEQGRDRDGWADLAQTQPGPPSPDLMLNELEFEIEELAPFGTRQPKEGPKPTTEQLMNWARRLRWLRLEASDKLLWGTLAGRLRYWAQDAPLEVRQLLDPGFRPGRSWATLLRTVEEHAKHEEDLESVLESIPDRAASDAEIVRWVGKLLPLPADYTPLILSAAAPLQGRILGLGLDESHFPGVDRRARRRLQKIVDALRPSGEPSQVESSSPTTSAPAEATEQAPPETLLARTRGQRVLFVSNRSDSFLQEKLQSAFEFKQLDWAEATPRRVEAATEAIASGTYDLVLGATGFLSHKEDGRLQRVCKSAGVPYVRANRGRPGAVQIALARDLLGIAS